MSLAAPLLRLLRLPPGHVALLYPPPLRPPVFDQGSATVSLPCRGLRTACGPQKRQAKARRALILFLCLFLLL